MGAEVRIPPPRLLRRIRRAAGAPLTAILAVLLVALLAVLPGLGAGPAHAAVTAAHALFQGMVTDEYRGPDGMFGDEVKVDDDAPALDRLVAFSGRDPEWSPPAS